VVRNESDESENIKIAVSKNHGKIPDRINTDAACFRMRRATEYFDFDENLDI